ncbi:type VII secretion protein EccCb [Thermogemmatispora sp.]|uniref:type VII secretion protein EccCb n=1 Tax=Thermogemmatispora sp. TaxID=1968838 RepID=UPI001DE69A5B|nr:type VII secretion protein EccCb [Thermogemmatispora sp.]MBX5450536.1 type VII secretion protein EccCb [Thermogemmatispora sp.]
MQKQATTFYRPARAYPPRLPSDEIVISAPPTQQPAQSGPLSWLQYLLPVLGSLGSVFFMFTFHTNPLMVVASCGIGGMMIMSGLIMGVIQRRALKKQQQQQRSLYLDYLERVRKHLLWLAKEQRLVEQRLYPPYEELAERVERREYLWERRPTDFDFMMTRIGIGPGPLCCPLRLDISNANFMAQYVPELRAQAEALVAEYSYLNDVAALIPLRSFGTLAISGSLSAGRALARAIICQLVAFHAPEDVRCLVYFPGERVEEWNWLKWLPHVRRLHQVKAEHRYAPEQLCMLATTVGDLQQLLQQQIKPEVERRTKLSEEAGNDEQERRRAAQASLPHLVVVLDSFSPHEPVGQLPELELLFAKASQAGVTVICLVEDRYHEPAAIQARLELSEVGGLHFEEIAYGGRRMEGLLPDQIEPALCERIARSLAPLTLSEASQQDLSQDIRLLELLTIPSADSFNPGQCWQATEEQYENLLRVPIGRRADGHPLVLDLKEAADKGMGPHGLIVGATGSGKSELLRTLVSALAITHDPRTLNFVLIDFKGGASFNDFQALPHVVGVVTNLQSDLALVDRVYAALLGEQQRRQRMLRDAGNLDNIKQYRAKWKMHPEMEPMPHLLIIVDEFAELIAQRSDFLDLFVTMGRVGRSLGLHLLFATQRLEEGRIKGLESHLRYRICLRTYSAAESRTVLGTADAYYLPSVPGIGYFKVDVDTYELFKSALISVPYLPLAEQHSLESKIRIFTANGKLLHYQQVVGDARRFLSIPAIAGSAELHTEMDVVIERIAKAVPPVFAHLIHQVWLPPLPRVLTLDAVLAHTDHPHLTDLYTKEAPPFGDLRVPVGLVDKPLEQVQEPLWLDFSGTGGHLAIIGAPQSGKSTFLRTLITSFMLTHTPRDVQFYCIDMGGGLLRIFEQAPHVGAVCGKPERDKIRRVVRQMRRVIEEREFLFRERGIDSMTTFRAMRQRGELDDVPFGDVFLIIDNFAQFYQDFDQLEPDLAEIVSSGLAYGVHLIIAANRWAEVRPRLRDNIGTRLELRLNDPIDSELGRAIAAAIPAGVPGRGANRDKLFFQIALPLIAGDGQEAIEHLHLGIQGYLLNLIERIRRHWKGLVAPPVLMLPPLVRWEDLPEPSPEEPPGVPIGLEEFRLKPVYIDLITAGPHFLILGDSECGKTSLLRAWIRGLERRYTPQQVAYAIVDFRKRLLDFVDSKALLTYAYNSQTLTNCVGNLKVDLERRLKRISEVPLTELRRPQQWTGRHYFLFVDDYEAIGGSGSSPLVPLQEYLLVGSDIGFHLVLVHRVGGVSRAMFEPIMQRLREMGTPGLILSGDPMEGKLLHGLAATPLPPGRAYLVQPKHPPMLVQLAFAAPQWEEAQVAD